jgi:hypothetical protein
MQTTFRQSFCCGQRVKEGSVPVGSPPTGTCTRRYCPGTRLPVVDERWDLSLLVGSSRGALERLRYEYQVGPTGSLLYRSGSSLREEFTNSRQRARDGELSSIIILPFETLEPQTTTMSHTTAGLRRQFTGLTHSSLSLSPSSPSRRG